MLQTIGGSQPFRAFKAQMLQRLLWRRRVFKIDIKTCSKCSGAVKVIACIEDPVIIDKILTHLNEKAPPVEAPLPKSRAPPLAVLFD